MFYFLLVAFVERYVINEKIMSVIGTRAKGVEAGAWKIVGISKDVTYERFSKLLDNHLNMPKWHMLQTLMTWTRSLKRIVDILEKGYSEA